MSVFPNPIAPPPPSAATQSLPVKPSVMTLEEILGPALAVKVLAFPTLAAAVQLDAAANLLQNRRRVRVAVNGATTVMVQFGDPKNPSVQPSTPGFPVFGNTSAEFVVDGQVPVWASSTGAAVDVRFYQEAHNQ